MPVVIIQSNEQNAAQSAGNKSVNVLSSFTQKIKQFAQNIAIV